MLAVSIAFASIGYGWIESAATAEPDIRHVAEADEVQKALRLGKPSRWSDPPSGCGALAPIHARFICPQPSSGGLHDRAWAAPPQWAR